MSIAQPLHFKIRLSDGLIERPLRGMLGHGDARANKIVLEMMTDAGSPADLDGVSASGSFYMPPDGDEIGLAGTIVKNIVTVTLLDECYAHEGRYTCEIRLTKGSERRTVLAISGQVLRFGSGALASVAGVTNIDELLAEIGTMREATAAANAAAENAKKLVNTATAENLLDNSFFSSPVNQRGGVLYPASAGYKIDRWRTGSNTTLIVAPGAGLSIINEGTSVSGITQYIMDVRKEPNAGEWMTLACADNQGNIYCGSAIVPEGKFVTAFANAEKGIHGNIYPEIVSESGSVTPARVQLLLQPGTQIILSWAALYRGKFTKDTLPPYTPKPYSLELAECQRYYFRATGYNAFFGYCNSATNAYLYAVLPVPMRTVPTITLIDATLLVRTDDGGRHDEVTIVQAASMFGTLLRFQANRESGGMKAGIAFAMLNSSSGVLEVSAEP